jgi:hypothetical protein
MLLGPKFHLLKHGLNSVKRQKTLRTVAEKKLGWLKLVEARFEQTLSPETHVPLCHSINSSESTFPKGRSPFVLSHGWITIFQGTCSEEQHAHSIDSKDVCLRSVPKLSNVGT